jgi:NADH-quinone oxidoreductase subunit N
LAALRQTSLKRLLAYSSIAHAGYILVGLAAGTPSGAEAAMYYLISYAFMNIGAFAVVIMLEKQGEMDASGERLRGLARREPVLAFVMAIFLLSLAGVPPFAGFFAKFFVFSAAVQGGMSWLAAIAMLNSAIGAYYYLRITVSMYFGEPGDETVTTPVRSRPATVGMYIALVFTVLLGIFPMLWFNLLQSGITQVALK